VAAWVLFFHDPEHALGARSPTEALYSWMDDSRPVTPADFVHAAAGDHELALLALTAGITADELARRVAAGTVDRKALQLRATLR
jgi:hypothetical protein